MSRATPRWLNRAALLGVAIWLVVFGLIPIFHSIDHKNDHVHLPNGGIVYDTEAPAGEQDAPAPHGKNSLEHLGSATVILPLVFEPALIALELVILSEAPQPILHDFTQPAAIWARGPPRSNLV